MTLFDLFVLAVMALSVLFGATRGLAREAITLLALAGGAAAVAALSGPLDGVLGGGVASAIVLIVLLFGIGFVLVHVLLEALLRHVAGPAPRRPDKLLGGLFGLARGWFVVSMTFLAAGYYFAGAPLPDVLSEAWTRSFAASGAAVLEDVGVAGRQEDAVSESVEIID